VNAAKAMRDFARTHEVFEIKGGLLGREFLTPERIAELASVEPREVLLAKLAGALQAPIANMAGLLAALPRNAATAMQQLLEKKEQGTPEEEAAPAEGEAADAGETTAAGDEPQPEAGDSTAETGSDTESEIQAGAEVSAEDAEPEPEDVDDAADAAPEE
jgi:large subunit ribosomal protein L10